MHRLRRRIDARSDGGFTLVELLMAMTIGLIILSAATLITIGAARHNNEVASRTFANQRGRLAMERIVRLLRSSACVTGSPTSVTAATATSITFYADIAGGTAPMQHVLTFNPTAGTLTDQAAPVANLAATRTETLATNVVAKAGSSVFRYYAYPTSVPTTGTFSPSVEMVPAGTGLTPLNLGSLARIDLDFLVTGELRKTANIRAEMNDQVFMRLADPNRASAAPKCS